MRRALYVALMLICLIKPIIAFEGEVGLQLGNRFIKGPLILKGGNETVIIDEYVVANVLGNSVG